MLLIFLAKLLLNFSSPCLETQAAVCVYVCYTHAVLICVFSLINSRYRKALSNNCSEGSVLKYSPRRQKCPSQAPRGLQLFTSEGTLVATLGRNVTFLVFLDEVLTSLQLSDTLFSSCISRWCQKCSTGGPKHQHIK